jgi:hypothetical protein
MKRSVIDCAVSVILLGVSLVAAPDSVCAQGGRDRQSDWPVGVPPAAPRPVAPPPTPQFGAGIPRPVVPGHGVSRPFVHRPFAPTAFGVPVYVPSSVSVGSGDSVQPPAAYDSGMFYAPPGDTGPVVPPPPPPSVIEYSTGRYELRGDGVATPYLWVWVPNPPPAPPAASAVPPVPSSPPGPSPASSEIYRFTDEQGVINWTDRWESIPERYRSQAKRLPL